MEIPTLYTERLILRAPSLADFETYVRFYADAEASSFYGGPMTAAQAWRKLAYDLGHWALRGFGIWALAERQGGQTIGGCGIVWPEGWPRHELTWWIVTPARRKGYAEEGSRAVINWAKQALGWTQVETHINDRNEAARRLAAKLGGLVVARELFPDGLGRDIYSILPPSPETEVSHDRH